MQKRRVKKHKVAITGLQTISAFGVGREEIWGAYKNGSVRVQLSKAGDLIFPLSAIAESALDTLEESNNTYKALDKTVKMVLLVARAAIKEASWQKGGDFGINIGSSRGATQLFEKYYRQFLQEGRTETLSSPTTTLGNIASWIAQDLQARGPEISHSITCSTALHALINGVAWLRSGMCEKFMVGGSEAPLTPFTIAQMRALKVYAREAGVYPCKALDLSKKKNTMILGEGAGVACLELGEKSNALAYISSIGYATEALGHPVSLSAEAFCFQRSMNMALEEIEKDSIDAIVMHAPGTIQGDLSEYRAVEKVFGAHLPALTSNKWQLGHSFGASGLLSIDFAVLMLQNQQFVAPPYVKQQKPKSLNKILVNAVGFGGNAVSVLIERA